MVSLCQILKKNVKREMDEIYSMTREVERERALTICIDDNDHVFAGRLSVGDAGAVDPEERPEPKVQRIVNPDGSVTERTTLEVFHRPVFKCPAGTEQYAVVHTHPKGKNARFLSGSDLNYTLQSGLDAICLITPDKKLRCVDHLARLKPPPGATSTGKEEIWYDNLIWWEQLFRDFRWDKEHTWKGLSEDEMSRKMLEGMEAHFKKAGAQFCEVKL